ncbi:hypothetical protein GS891_04570 [Rhodococcus hoagii]|nr:hypothetical protein [Prescottella equi]
MENLVKRLAEEPAVRADWPLCARCTSILRLRRLTAATLAIAGALAFMGAVVLGSVDIRGSGVTAAFVGGLCAIALSVPVVYTTRAERILRATTTPDGSAGSSPPRTPPSRRRCGSSSGKAPRQLQSRPRKV